MPVSLIAYDLNEPDEQYRSLREAIKTYEAWWHHLDAVWLVDSPATPYEIRNHLSQFLYSEDELLVIAVYADWATEGVNRDAADWLNEYV